MIPKVEYNIDKKPLIKNCLRKKAESLENIEETRRESENMKCVYQRESEIPKMPRDTGASSSLNISVMKIPPYRQGCHIQTISIKEAPQDLPIQNSQIPIESYSPPMNFQFHSLKESEVKAMPPQPTMPMYTPSPMPNPMNPYNPYMMPMAPNPMMPMPMMPNSYASPVINPGYYPPMNPVYQPMPGYPPNPLTTNPAMKKPFLINPLTNKPPGFKTLPCRNFHSTIGCARGDNCHFIHDFQFQGRAIPNFEQWKITNEERLKNLPNSKEAMQPIYFPPPPAK
ncbi:unnamed protein product [Blepharisma stoltei]|uniref:C3H1-type domain-containing protein n=1 Tax=Blepharisma stoltei TaxID=1481888 RepID=A0AAU9K3W8_9CILI|nr:unnamed protein product [Blepharisma stoltei]